MTGPWMALVLSLTVLVIVLAVLVLGLMRRVVPLLEGGGPPHATRAFGGLTAGETVPPFEVRERDGTPIASDRLFHEARVVVFMSASCQPCRVVAGELREHWDDVARLPLLVVLSDDDASREMDLPPGLHVVFERDGAASTAFRNAAVPRAYAVDEAGVVTAVDGVAGVRDLSRLHDALTRGGDAAAPREVSLRS